MTKEDFWTWFDNHKETLERLFDGKGDDYGNIFESLSKNLKQYSGFLIPELAKKENNQFVFIISCDGVKKGMPFVESLANNKKQFDSWIVQKYSNPDPQEFILLNGLKLKRRKIFLTWDTMPSKNYQVIFYIKGYSSSDLRYKAITVMHLQYTLGEFNAMTKIERVEFKKLSILQSTKNLKTLEDFKKEIDVNLP